MTVRTLEEQVLAVTRWAPDGGGALALLHFGSEARTLRLRIPRGAWARLVDSAEERFGGPGARSPQRLSTAAAGLVEVTIAGHAAAIYLRDTPVR